MSNSIPLDPSTLKDRNKQLRRISIKASDEAFTEPVVANTRSVDDDLNHIDDTLPIIDVENVISSSSIHTSTDHDNQGGIAKRLSVSTDLNSNIVETKQSLSNIFSEIDALTSSMSVAIDSTNTSSGLIASTTAVSQSVESTIGTTAKEQVSKEEQDKLALAARLKAKLKEKAYTIPSFSNLLMDPYNRSTDPYNSSSSAGAEEVNTATTTTNSKINPVPTSEPIKVWSASAPLELGELSPINDRSRSSTPDKMSARKASKKSKKNTSIITISVSDDGMGDNTAAGAPTTTNDDINRNSSSNSIATASSAASTPNRKSVSKGRGDKDRGEGINTHGTGIGTMDSPSMGGAGTTTKRASMAGPKVKNIKDLKIKVRPTEPLRCGYLHKLDMDHLPPIDDDVEHAEEEEEAWTTQYVTMDVPTGQLEYFTEINRQVVD